MIDTQKRAGFTLVEMMVIAPIVILLIGAFIALIVNLTGEVLSSRGSNVLTYDVQDALNRIEQDVKLSTTYLSESNIDIDGDTSTTPNIPATKQGYARNASEVTAGSTVRFSNIAKTNGSNASLILNVLATNDNPLSNTANFVYLANQPNSCSNIAEYSKNTPLSTNVVYFVDDNETLWRRTIMPYGYDTASNRCGTAPWQQPSCAPGYSTASAPFCRTNDIKLVEGVRPVDFQVSYYTSASSAAATTAANNPADATAAGDAVRNAALQSTPTVSVSIISRKTIAGREISQSGTVRATRLDTNASGIATQTPVTAAPAVPKVSSNVSDGHYVNFSWPRVDTATSYDLEYRINGGAWQTSEGADLDNNSRKFTVSTASHQDAVEARVRATNSFGDSSWASNSITIPLWAPLILKGGWTDYAQGYATAAYTKTKAGVVMLKGLVRGGTGDIGTLPPDYAPQKAIMFPASSNQTIGRLDIRADGTVDAEVGDTAWFSLDGTAYMPNGTTFTNLSYQNGWSTWDANWNPAGYAVDSVGRVHLRGLMRGGTVTAGTTIASIPAAILAPEYTHWVQLGGNSVSHLSTVPSNSTLIAKIGATTSYNSISAMYYTSTRASGTNCTTQWCNMSLQNAWAHYGSPYSTPQYTKGSDGIVSLKGLIKSGTSANITTLPAGYCPKQRLLGTVVTADVWGRVDMIPQSNGTCILTGSSYSTTWLSLDSFKYVAE